MFVDFVKLTLKSAGMELLHRFLGCGVVTGCSGVGAFRGACPPAAEEAGPCASGLTLVADCCS